MDQPNVVLPKELRLAAPATMPQSRSYMFKQTAALSNYSPRDTIQINLPRLQRSYLTKDSYLEFDVTFKHTPPADFANSSLTLDTPGAFGLIDRIEVYDYLGSTQLESTAGFGQLVGLLQETCVAQDEYATHWEVTTGGHGAQTVYDWERSSQKGHESLTADCKVFRPTQPLIGEVLDHGTWANDANPVAANQNERTIRRKYHIPLFSFLGLLSPKYAPLHNGYTIMITLNTAENALISAGAKYVFESPLIAVANTATTAGTTATGTTLTIPANSTIKVGWNVYGAGMTALGTVTSRPSATSVVVNSAFTPTASTYGFAAPGTAILINNTATTAGDANGTALTLAAANTTIQQGWTVFGAGMTSVGTVVGRASGTSVRVDLTFTPTASSYLFATPLSGPTSTSINTSTGVSFTVNNARMCCQILELGPIAESMLLSTTGNQPMIVTTKAYRNYPSSFPDKTGTFRLDLNINVASLTNVLWMMRPTLHMNNVAYPTLSHRQRNFLESWYFQYGSSILPQTQGIIAFKPSSNDASHKDFGSEALIELLKARHMYNQPTHQHLFNKWNWAYDNVARSRYLTRQRIAGSHSLPQDIEDWRYATSKSVYEHGKFACGLDLELVAGRTNEIICGMNTNGMNTSIFATFNATAAAADVVTDANVTDASTGIWVEGCNVDAWCEYDAFVNISPGIATTVSF